MCCSSDAIPSHPGRQDSRPAHGPAHRHSGIPRFSFSYIRTQCGALPTAIRETGKRLKFLTNNFTSAMISTEAARGETTQPRRLRNLPIAIVCVLDQ